eukprot:g3753.t1
MLTARVGKLLRQKGGVVRGVVPRLALRSLASTSSGDESLNISRSESLKSWVDSSAQVTNDSVTLRMVNAYQTDASEIVPWFHEQMPDLYFQSVPLSDRLDHLRLLTTFHGSVAKPPQVAAWSSDGTQLTILINNLKGEEDASAGKLLKMLQPSDVVPASVETKDGHTLLSRVSRFVSKDNSLTVMLFQYGSQRVLNPNAGVPKSEKIAVNRENVLKWVENEKARGNGNDIELRAQLQKTLNLAADQLPANTTWLEPESLKTYMDSQCSDGYLRLIASPRTFMIHRALFESIKGSEGARVHVERIGEHNGGLTKQDGSPEHRIILAANNVIPKVALRRVVEVLNSYGLSTLSINMDTVEDPSSVDAFAGCEETGLLPSKVTLLRMRLSQDQRLLKGLPVLDENGWQQIRSDIVRLKWLDNFCFDIRNNPVFGDGMTLAHAEVISAMTHVLHGPMAKLNQHLFTLSGIKTFVCHREQAPFVKQIAELFMRRFVPNKGENYHQVSKEDESSVQPECLDGEFRSQNNDYSNISPITDEEYRNEVSQLKQSIIEKVESGAQISQEGKQVLFNMIDVIDSTLKTNFFVPHRFALGLRLDPAFMGTNEVIGTDLPYGTFFLHGRSFNGFHVRFRDTSRGGLRVVVPQSEDQYAAESSRLYGEAYSLAFAQQLKNKDIPEGGSKAALLVRPGKFSNVDPHFLVRKSVKAFTDTILDLISPVDHVKAHIVDKLGKDELLYLGPDENIIPQDIIWMAKQAEKRGYPIPPAFISSKPNAGINHKDYGVTSEGVNVFLDVALRKAGFLGGGQHGDRPFSLKVTGGTDGDVAGNCLKLLAERYDRSQFNLVGICDGTATIEDPEGIDMDEILQMVDESLPLSSFTNKNNKLSSQGRMILADHAEGIAARNTMHNRVKADAFIPAGGRPATINEQNWKSFICEDGKPSSPLIVEGANLYITPQARQALFDNHGVTIVKDSSANKCGVVTSSYEIISAMLLDEKTFIDNKEEIVSDVRDRLRELAQVEAELLFREYHSAGGTVPLPVLSTRVSNAVIRTHDVVYNSLLEDMPALDDPLVKDCLNAHLPKKLGELSGDLAAEKLPLTYLQAIMACSLASRIVYEQGVSYIEAMESDEQLQDIAFRYMSATQRIQTMKQQLANVPGVSETDAMVMQKVLGQSGVRTLLEDPTLV